MAGSGNSIVDEDTARTVASGRETLGSMLSTAQTHLQKVFIVFVIGFLASFYGLRLYAWPLLLSVTKQKLPPGVLENLNIVAVTPFDVILLQAKIGAISGILLSIPVLLYYSRDTLRKRDWYPEAPVARWKLVLLGLLAAGLFVGGLYYGYALFFPLMFEFLAGNAVNAGFAPNYSIVKWTEFIGVLSLSFGLAAEMPLVMSGLSYTGIVSYETFRDKWRYAVLGIFGFGAVFSPPDPFTQVMWAAPLLVLYGFSLALSRTVTAAKRRDADSRSSAGSPADIDIDSLDAGAVRAAPPEVFAEMSEAESVEHAREAMDDDNPEKAQAILDRFDEVQEAEEQADEEGDADADPDRPDNMAEDLGPKEEDEDGNVLESTAAGMANAFTEDETTEDDIGGYYYDITFILESLTSKMFYIVGLFMAVLAGVFVALYRGGIGVINDDFTQRVPAAVQSEGEQLLNVVTLHPVEALVFEVKISTLIAAVAVLPLVLYFAWPAMKDRGIASGNRNVFITWGGTIAVGLLAGSALGYMFVAPSLISWLVADAKAADMIISYRVSNFFWLVFFTTVGIGLLADIPLTMLLFDRGNIVSFKSMRDRWRVFVVAVFAVAALVTPDSLYTMFLVGIPVSLAYGLGLGMLWVTTLGGRQ